MSYDGHDRCRRCGGLDDGHSRDDCDRRIVARNGNAGAALRVATAPDSDPMAAPHVAVTAEITGGSVRLTSASGGLESLWVHLRNDSGDEVIFDRVTPSQARALAALLTRYADSHRDSR